MKEIAEIKAILEDRYRDLPTVIENNLENWGKFVKEFPIGTRVIYGTKDKDVRVTVDGRIYDDPDDPYVAVSDGGLWPIDRISKVG